MSYREIKGDLIKLAKEGNFDVITHGCNCFCNMGAGIAPQMHKAFGVGLYRLEGRLYKGDINKLGQIDYQLDKLTVVNSYTQYRYGKNHPDGDRCPVDYDAIRLCLRKINHQFKGERVGLPKIGAGLAGGDWVRIREIIISELKDCETTVVIFEK